MITSTFSPAELVALGLLQPIRRGLVKAYDAEVGLGVASQPGGASFAFHCSAIADGSRQIGVGQAVAFRLRFCVGGAIEASDLHSI